MKKHMNQLKKIICLLICVLMTLASLATYSAYASDEEYTLYGYNDWGNVAYTFEDSTLSLSVYDTTFFNILEVYSAQGRYCYDCYVANDVWMENGAEFVSDWDRFDFDCLSEMVVEPGDWVFTLEVTEDYNYVVTYEPGAPDHSHDFDNEGFCTICSLCEPAQMNGEGYCEIENAGQLYWFANQVNDGDDTLNAKLMNDIDLNGAYSDRNMFWTPIADFTRGWYTIITDDLLSMLRMNISYNGIFDGNNKTISGLEVEDTFDSFKSFFGVVGENGVVRNLTVDNSFMNYMEYYGEAAIAGCNMGLIENCVSGYNRVQFAGITNFNLGKIDGCCNMNTIFDGVVGAGIALINTGEITDCKNYSSVTTAGITYENDGRVSDCANFAELINACGIAMINENNAVIERCYNAGDMFVDMSAGIVQSNGGIIRNCYNTGNSAEMTFGAIAWNNDGMIQNCYNTGMCTDEFTGFPCAIRLVDYNGRDVQNCYNIDYDYSSDNIEMKTAEEFASGEVAYLLQADQTELVWGQNIDNGKTPDAFPVLKGAQVYVQKDCTGNTLYAGNTPTEQEVVHNYNSSNVCTDCAMLKEGEVVGLAGHTLSVEDTLGVNYYIAVSDDVLEDEEAKIVFTVGDGEDAYVIEKSVAEAVSAAAFDVRRQNGLLAVTCDVSAKEVTATIYAKLVANGTETPLPSYSVMQYAEAILSDEETYADAIPVVKAMLNYSAAAQAYFGYNTEHPANATEFMTDADRFVDTDIDLSIYEAVVSGESAGVSYYGSSLVLESETSIKHYFIVDESVSAESLQVTVSGEEAELTKNGDLYCLRIDNIFAQNLDEVYEVKIDGITLEYSVLSYGYAALNTNKTTLINTLCALYDYHLAAKEYGNK